ncbi:MAG: hypothetical protein GY749_03895 [Desulfobacteraceae bacterium]|nr:hypothetical protein [Desulfobacteraceae bacterium]
MEPFEISNSDFTEWDSALLVQHYPSFVIQSISFADAPLELRIADMI